MFGRALRYFRALLLVLVLTSGPGLAPAETSQVAKIDLTVSAAISLKEALDEVKQLYVRDHPNVSIGINYGGSGTLQIQIEQGAPVDVFFSAAPAQMDALNSKGLLLAGTRKDLLHNEVVLIVPSDSVLKISSFRDLTGADVKKIALGEPQTVPAGEYAKEVLTNLGIYDAVNAKAVLAKDVRQVLTYVETGNVDAGVVYATDAQSSSKVRVVAKAPEKSHAPVIYPIAVLKSSTNPAVARQFVDFLASPRALAIFQKYGFAPANP